MSPVCSLNNMATWGLMKVFFLVCVCALLSEVEGQSSSISCQPHQKACGDTCCRVSDYCEESDGKGTCHAEGTRVDCDFMYYCYSPTTCCGFGDCCPANSTCCGLNSCCALDAICCSGGSLGHCCPANSICCGITTCCPQGSTCTDGYRCVSTSTSFFASRWYFTVLVLIPLIIFVLFLRQKMLQRRRNAQYAARSEQINPVMTSTNGYNQPMPQHNYTAPPPLYTEIDQGPPADFQMAPPPYEEVVKSNEGNIPHNSEHIDQPAAPQQQAEEPTSQSTATVTPPSQ